MLDPKQILKKRNNDIYLIDNYNYIIIIGFINDDLIFIANYIISYKTQQTLNKEKNILLNNSIQEFIKYINNEYDINREIILSQGGILELNNNKSINDSKFKINPNTSINFSFNEDKPIAVVTKLFPKNNTNINSNNDQNFDNIITNYNN